MGIFESFAKRQRVKKAAEEMWNYVKRGIQFEVPLSLQADDISTLAIIELQRKHPEVRAKVYQSRGVVLGLHESGAPHARNPISDTAWGMLNRGGYRGLDGQQLKQADIEANLDAHVAWLNAQGLDPKKQEEEAQEQERKKYRMEVSSEGVKKLENLSSAQRAQRIADEVFEREMAADKAKETALKDPGPIQG